MSTLADKAFAHSLFRYVVEFRKAWCAARSEYLGCPRLPKGLMYNDEVQVPMISPRIYRDLILPYEKDLHDFYHGLHYWHSCGDATPFMPLVNELPEIEMIQCGAFSEPEEVIRTFGQRSVLEIAVHPIRDFVEASEKAMRSHIEYLVGLVRQYEVRAAMIRLTAYETDKLNARETLAKAVRWAEIAQEVTRSAT